MKWEDLTRRVGIMGAVDQVYEGSLCNALQAIYPEYDWYPWEFHHVRGYIIIITKSNQQLIAIHSFLSVGNSNNNNTVW